MQYLIDTHIAIWFIEGDEALPRSIKSILKDGNNDCFVSIASLWEIAIKSSIGKLKLNIPFHQIEDFLFRTEIKILPISVNDLRVLTNLELIHRDPFDRIIISQAINNSLMLLSVDKNFKNYPVHLYQ